MADQFSPVVSLDAPIVHGPLSAESIAFHDGAPRTSDAGYGTWAVRYVEACADACVDL